jgi:hypothetical protein
MAQTRALKSAASAATGLLTVAAAALALAGCGGSSTHNNASSSASAANSSAPSASVEASAGQSSSTVIAGTSGSKSKSSAAASGGSASGGSGAGGSKSTGASNGKSGAKTQLRAVDVVSKPGPHKARGGPDEPQVPQIKAPNPCRLVSVHEVSSILGGVSVQQTEAPLGPTCIMKVDSQKQVITLAVEAVSVKTQVKNMHEVQTAVVGGHQTYCGKLGSSQFYLSLGGGKAIAVTAPCPVARALAATALSHLKA